MQFILSCRQLTLYDVPTNSSPHHSEKTFLSELLFSILCHPQAISLYSELLTNTETATDTAGILISELLEAVIDIALSGRQDTRLLTYPVHRSPVIYRAARSIRLSCARQGA